jgi:PAS domain-containing protein
MTGKITDITDHKRAEQELTEANERLRLAMEAGSAGGWEFDLRTGRNLWFGEAHSQLGMTPDETSGSRMEFWNRVHEGDRERVKHALEVAREKREDFTEDFVLFGTTGRLTGCVHGDGSTTRQTEKLSGC